MTTDSNIIRLRKRPFLTRLWRHYRVYRGAPLWFGPLKAFKHAWHLATL
jgi:hypothetical protein